MKPRALRLLTIALATTALAAPLAAQEETDTGDGLPLDDAKVVLGTDWDYADLYDGGISVDQVLYDAEVYGANGEEIGSIEDVIVSPDGKVLSVIAEVGGFWDIGDTHVNIPYDQIEISADGERVDVPVTEENVDDYDFEQDYLSADVAGEEVVAGVDDADVPRAWRLSELIGDYARLTENDRYVQYGYVSDVILRDGEIAAVVVQHSNLYGGGYRAYPYYGYGARSSWYPGAPVYVVPYDEQEIRDLEPFNYDQMAS